MAITICDSCELRRICLDKNKFYPVVKCQNYHEGEAIMVEQTNEEWFASLPTTEKSSFLAKIVTEAIKEHGKCGATRCESSIWWDEWLKQPHPNE